MEMEDISMVSNGSMNGLMAKKTAKFKGYFHIYVAALRPWSFSASLTPVILGFCLSYKMHGLFDILTFSIVCLTALSVHAAGNLVNTYYDFKRGVDTKKSDDKTLVEGRLSSDDVATYGGLCYAVGCFGLLALCAVSPASLQHLSLVYFCGLSGSFMYTGGLGLKYIALGDIVIFLTFGPLTVMFAYLAMTGKFALATIPYAVPLALNIECILHVNNCRDKVSDRNAKIVTLAIILGPTLSYLFFCILLFGPYIAFTFVTINFSPWFILPASTIMYAFSVERSFRSGHLSQLPHDVATLNLLLGVTFVCAIFFSKKENLPFATYF